MLFYALYCLGYASCMALPLPVSYAVAKRLADFCYLRSITDRLAVTENLKAILGKEEVSPSLVREVFRNFAMYLVDFFRFSRLSPTEIQKSVRLEGLEHMRSALRKGRGAVGLTAHLGNFELAGAVLALLGLPVTAVVLRHMNPRVNAFFDRQRRRVGVKAIIWSGKNERRSFEAASAALGRNEILALVGDRDFFDHGLTLPLFGKEIKIPTGPAAFSVRMGAPIVPGFLIREKEGSYRFVLEPALEVPEGLSRGEQERRLTQECLERMSHYIRRYPTQWYMFQKFWSPGPATIL